MAYAKTSLRAEQRALREEMRGLGMSHRQIAAEFARRYRMRPRAAWRHAHGWSLTEAGQQISAYAACTGLDAGGVTVAMTAAHLCEHENWPGEGSAPAGRRPTPYFLSLLAAVYGSAVQDLLDVADYRHMPPADRLILDKTTRADRHDDHDMQPGVQAPRRPVAAPAEQPPHTGPEPPAASGAAGLSVRSAPGGFLPGWQAPGPVPSGGHAGPASPYAVLPDVAGLVPGRPGGADVVPGVLAAAAVDAPMIRGALDALTAYERQFGGGHARAYAMDYLRHIVQPRLHAAAGERAFRDLCGLAVEFSLRVASMQLDSGDARASRGLLGAGLPLAQETGSPVMVAWVLARLGELDMRERNVDRALGYTGGAAAMAGRSSPRARSFILAKHALALSMAGDRAGTLRVLGRVQDSFEKAGASTEPAWMRFYGLEHLRHGKAQCLNNLGMGDEAVRAAEESMRGRRLSRPRAFSLAVQAIGHLQSRDKAVDRACEVGTELVIVTGQLASDRVKVELARVLEALAPYRQSAAVRELAEAARPVLADYPDD